MSDIFKVILYHKSQEISYNYYNTEKKFNFIIILFQNQENIYNHIMKTKKNPITIVGLGYGGIDTISLQSYNHLVNTTDTVYFRTLEHPSIPELAKKLKKYDSFDQYYHKYKSFDKVYEQISKDLIKLAKDSPVTYAVPGSVFTAEKAVKILQEKHNNIIIHDSMGFINPLMRYINGNFSYIDCFELIDNAGKYKLTPDRDTIIGQVYDTFMASEAKLSLMEIYPEDYTVKHIYHLGLDDERITEVPLYMLDRKENTYDHLTSIMLAKHSEYKTPFDRITHVIAQLRDPVSGCPWDLKQTHATLTKHLIEESYEVLDAIERDDMGELCDELGDIYLQVALHSQIADDDGDFNVYNVLDQVADKMIRRHPHVFHDNPNEIKDEHGVSKQWEQIKKGEKKNIENKTLLDSVQTHFPGMIEAYKLQNKAATIGFDWDSIEPVLAKLQEEIDELKEGLKNGDKENIIHEYGDIAFALANLARFLHIYPEEAIKKANQRFRNRMSYIENELKKGGIDIHHTKVPLTKLEELWQESKKYD